MSASIGSCSACVCKTCLWYQSGRCPYGGCYDDLRAREQPWAGRVRTSWSNWERPGEQAHWCRGGSFYPVRQCDEYAAYDGGKHTVEECLLSNIERFQDGFIRCSLVENTGCEECYRQFEQRQERRET